MPVEQTKQTNNGFVRNISYAPPYATAQITVNQITTFQALTKELETCAKKLEQSSDENSKKKASSSSTSPEKRKRRENKVDSGEANPPTKPSEGSQQQQQHQVVLAPTQEMLVEKIVRLQQILARRKEKMEVLEEHRRHLVKELRKKTAIIQHYVLKDGDHHQGIVPEDSDRHKVSFASPLPNFSKNLWRLTNIDLEMCACLEVSN